MASSFFHRRPFRTVETGRRPCCCPRETVLRNTSRSRPGSTTANSWKSFRVSTKVSRSWFQHGATRLKKARRTARSPRDRAGKAPRPAAARTGPRMALIELRDIRRVYQVGETELEVLKGINLDIEEGDFVAIMGPSGSG